MEQVKRQKKQKGCKFFIYSLFVGGERGIRTPGTSQFNGFQDRRNRPLCHLSLLVAAKVDEFFKTQKYSLEKNFKIQKKKSCIKVA